MAISSMTRRLVSGLGELYASVGSDDYPARVISVLSSLISVGSCSYNHLDGPRAVAYEIEPWDVVSFPDADALFRQHLPEHPVLTHVAATGDTRACRVSDLVSDRQFRSLGLYRDFYRQAEVDYQMTLFTPHPAGGEIALALNRQGRDFSAEELEVLELLRPHIAQSAALAGVLGNVMPAGQRDPAAQPVLTPRQTRIVRLVADGYTDRAIARALGISPRTVHAHLQRIYRALDVSSRTEALARLRELRRSRLAVDAR
ncbi:MAG TPA: LuxR C-terminal-related transcriptional regulator [Streptosporangiaceae bacterium]|nr:LuxR C-terminal-related transcriptional regulator [Streptosporangiaceae bacterium]